MKIPEVIDHLNRDKDSPVNRECNCQLLEVLAEIANEAGMNLPRLQGVINEALEHSNELIKKHHEKL